jgi:hypothetical protein
MIRQSQGDDDPTAVMAPKSAIGADAETGRTMVTSADPTTAKFQQGWDAAILAARHWHEGKAKQALVQSRRTRFPKALEHEAEVHRHSAEMIMTLDPCDV